MFKVDFRETGDVLRWEKTTSGVDVTVDEEYHPTIYLHADSWETVEAYRPDLEAHPKVVTTAVERWRPGWRHGSEDVLKVDLADIDTVDTLAPQIANFDRPGILRLYNVDFSRQFRYSLETESDPIPEHELSTLEIDVPATEFAGESPTITEATIDDEHISGNAADICETLLEGVEEHDPDVLILSTGEIVPTLFDQAHRLGRSEIALGRRPGYQKLASRSTYESYGRVGHSPARYNVPGRAIIDRSNSFFLAQTNLDGILDLVRRSGKPVQELGWASIGNVLTAIQIQEARERGVLVPWRSWRHEKFKSMRTLHAADRGGYTFNPDVGFHEDVYELDFSSLYPNIIVTRNISPETIRCDCHDSADVPELGYTICPTDGYLPDVLRPLIEDRDEIKAELAETDDPERREELQGRSDALKWILVSCFGYQGFSNAKFGRIEAHEAINAYARDILLSAKEALEAGGWYVIHGIVDSIWVTPKEGVHQTPLQDIAAQVSSEQDIDLEFEAAYEWVAFVPLADSEAGALTKYFGRRRDPPTADDRFKYRGIEVRQRSTCDWVSDVQRDLIEVLDTERDPEAVLAELQGHLHRLERGAVDPRRLSITNKVSKHVDEYTQATRNVAALHRADDLGVDVFPGQDVEYVVTNDDGSGRNRVRLVAEQIEEYDFDFYRDEAISAAESILSPLGWREGDIRTWLQEYEDTSISAWR
ncbi:MAG: type B DNA-directed DNA polymerase [Halodesulfurarchaeum sp.]